MTKNGIELLNSKQLVSAITNIEKLLPGYWWSISQKKDNIRISAGPSSHCLLDVYRAFSKTKEGDTGFHHDIDTTSGTKNISMSTNINMFVETIGAARDSLISTDSTMPPYLGPCRKQSKEELNIFKKVYTKFLLEIENIESNGFSLEEVYIGSCQLSVDTSLRGKKEKDLPVDISHDLLHQAILADSFSDAFEELKHRFAVEKV